MSRFLAPGPFEGRKLPVCTRSHPTPTCPIAGGCRSVLRDPCTLILGKGLGNVPEHPPILFETWSAGLCLRNRLCPRTSFPSSERHALRQKEARDHLFAASESR